MRQSQLATKSVNELLPYGFYIPPYQRGYRWRSSEVENLLEDIATFSQKDVENSDEKTWYCLQPLVVRPCDEETIITQNLGTDRKWFEVIDGQQRLTTIYLIMHYLNQGHVERRRKKLLGLRYATRDQSAEFLASQLDEKKIDKSNIDFYHISKAYQTVHEWVSGKGDTLDEDALQSKLLHQTKIIWYESQEQDPIAIFTRINIGKIPLTNAELVKALFLNSSNFKEKDAERIRLRQLEIAREWDEIEHELHNDRFWYFVGNGKKNADTRIEFILDLIAQKQENSGQFSTFNFFWDRFKSCTPEAVDKNWAEIKRHFQILKEWFEDRELYHKVGFLVADEVPVKDILKDAHEVSKKSFRDSLKTKIAGRVRVQLHKLEYGDGGIKKVLLLHNIQTMLNNKLETTYFPFDRYKKESWDIEHIHSVKDQMPQRPNHQKDWLTEASRHIKDDALKKKVDSFGGPDFVALYSEVLDHFSGHSRHHEDINNLSNLVLLDSGTNRGYKNAVFPVKRSTIIKKDREGTFIPICTRNLFMKYYTESVDQTSLWGEDDRAAYLDDILRVLKDYLPAQQNGGGQ